MSETRAAVLELVRREFGEPHATQFPEAWGPRVVVEAELADRSVFVKVAGDSDVFVERTVLRLAGDAGVPVPDVVASGVDPLVPGRRWIALAPARGVMWPLDDDRLTMQVIRDIANCLVRLRRVQPGGFGPLTAQGEGSYPTWRDWIMASAESNLNPLVAGGLATQAFRDKALSAFATLTPEIATGSMLHCDLSPSHVFVDPRTGAVTCIIDWGGAIVGDPVYDLAYFVAGGPADDPIPRILLPKLLAHTDLDVAALPLYQAHQALFNAEWSRREDIPWAPALLEKAERLLG